MAQQKQIQLVSMRMWDRSLASLNGLRIWHCHELECRSQTPLDSRVAVTQAGSYSSDSTPSLGTSIRCRCGPKKKKKKAFMSGSPARHATLRLPVHSPKSFYSPEGPCSGGSRRHKTRRDPRTARGNGSAPLSFLSPSL